MNRPTEADRLEELLNADGGAPDVRQTHISVVMLTASSAYKRLKPVRFDFLDFSTREGRYAHLASEARLNRRLAPGVYRKLVPVWRLGGGCRLKGTGPPDDWLLEMERLPEGDTLEQRLADGSLDEGGFDQMVDRLVAFFRAASGSEEITANGDSNVIRANLVDDFGVLDAAAADGLLEVSQVERLRSRQFQGLALLDEELYQRQRDGWIRDGHGDLRAEHVYLTAPVRIVDCIAFNHRLRWIDVADDVSFLATDLVRLGYDGWARRLVETYRERMDDPVSNELLAFYASYRFAVRAKVAVLRGREQAGDRQAEAIREGERLLALAVDAISWARPWLVVACGLSGTGKSTLARALCDRIGAARLSSDAIRKAMIGLAPHEPAPVDSAYDDIANAATYRELLDRAEDRLARGVSVVLDATFLRRADRAAVLALADRRGLDAFFVECRCPDEEVERRLVERAARGKDSSDATVDVWQAQRRKTDGYAGLPETAHCVADSSRPLAVTVDEIVTRLKAR